jgi:hypothetical protein
MGPLEKTDGTIGSIIKWSACEFWEQGGWFHTYFEEILADTLDSIFRMKIIQRDDLPYLPGVEH